MESVAGFQELFWSPSFWLPPNVTWADLEPDETVFIPKPRDLCFAFPMAIFLFVARLFWERYVALPIGRHLKIRENLHRSPTPNTVLEKAFRYHHKIQPNHDAIVGYSKQIDWTPRQIERWWRSRRNQGKPTEMQRFRETSWRFLFYFFVFWYGLYVQWDKPWLWDTRHCWYNYPRQHVSNGIWWYYMIELGFYYSLILSLFMDIKRKDFFEMIIHHIVTILLMAISWSHNMLRIGSLILVVHDAVDYWLEGAKLANYTKYQKLCDAMFVIFTCIWFITRIVFLPLRIMKATLFELPEIVGAYYAATLLNGLLLLLQILHVIWFVMILRMVYAYIVVGQVSKDSRSDSEPESEEEEEYTEDGPIEDKIDGHVIAANNNIGDQANGKKIG